MPETTQRTFQLREPENGIPLQNDRERIAECKTHFAQMLIDTRKQCDELGLSVLLAQVYLGRVTVSGNPETLNELMGFLIKNDYFEECMHVDNVENAAIRPLTDKPRMSVVEMIAHMRECGYCGFVRDHIEHNDMQDGHGFTSRDRRVFPKDFTPAHSEPTSESEMLPA
jgi:hypothetical protein